MRVILFIIIISLSFGNTILRRYKITEDTCIRRFQKRLFRYPYSSQAIVRKDLNKSLMVVSDYSAWSRILFSVGSANIDQIREIKSYGDNPGEVRFDRPAGVAVDVEGNVFVAVVSLKIYDIKGALVRVLEDGVKKEGMYKIVWNGDEENKKRVPSGVYFLVFRSDDFQSIKKLIFTDGK